MIKGRIGEMLCRQFGLPVLPLSRFCFQAYPETGKRERTVNSAAGFVK